MRLIAGFLILTAVSLFAEAGAAEAVVHNARIAELLEQDQADRKGFPNTTLSWKEINLRDEARREEILSMMKKGELRTAQDFFTRRSSSITDKPAIIIGLPHLWRGSPPPWSLRTRITSGRPLPLGIG